MQKTAIERIIEATGKTPAEIAKAINASPQNVNNWQKRGISKKGAQDIAKAFNLSLDWILTGKGMVSNSTLPQADKSNILDGLRAQIAAMQTSGVLTDEQVHDIVDTVRVAMPANDVPLISWVAAGSWSSVEPVTLDDAIGYYPRPRNLSADGFALKVRGRSMWPEFKPDDIIYVEPNISTLALKDGDLVVVQCNDDTEATFKQLVLGETESDMYLKPLNPDWPEQKMLPMGECRLVGKVVGKLVEY